MAIKFPPLKKSTKLSIIIAISFSFFLAEIGIGFYTHSLALVADAFHYVYSFWATRLNFLQKNIDIRANNQQLNDLVGFIVALIAFKASERDNAPPELSFGWQRATLLGAFFNGVFLLALGVSIFLQAIERFVAIERISQPKLVLIVGAVGFVLNVISVTILHEREHDVDTAASADPEGSNVNDRTMAMHEAHRHTNPQEGKKSHSRDLGVMGVLIHVAGDALNNIGVIIAGAVIWKTNSPTRFYIDPAVSVFIALMIFLSSIPLVKKSGVILLESVPKSIKPKDVQHDIEQVDGVMAVHELHIWRLNQQKTLASVHIVTKETDLNAFMVIANTITECLHAYGIHSATLQPEFERQNLEQPPALSGTIRKRPKAEGACFIGCPTTECENLTCCD